MDGSYQPICDNPAGTELPYPFDDFDPTTDGQFDKQISGDRTFDFNVDGLAHVGLFPDLLADARNLAESEFSLDPLMNSAEAFIRIWERIEGTPSPMAHWSCDEPDGIVAFDTAGGIDGTIVNGNRTAGGKAGSALYFPGGGYVKAPMGMHEQGFTIAAWARTSSPGGTLRVNAGSFDGAEGHDRHPCVDGEGYPCFRVWDAPGWCGDVHDADGQWHHWVFTVGEGMGQSAFIDGQPVGDHSGFTAQDRVSIGHSADGGYFIGTTDEVVICDSELTSEYISALFANAADADGEAWTTTQTTAPPTPTRGSRTCTLTVWTTFATRQRTARWPTWMSIARASTTRIRRTWTATPATTARSPRGATRYRR